MFSDLKQLFYIRQTSKPHLRRLWIVLSQHRWNVNRTVIQHETPSLALMPRNKEKNPWRASTFTWVSTVCVCVSAQWVNGDFLWFNAVWGWKRLNVCAQQRNSAGGILKSKTIKLSGVWCPPYSMPLKNCKGEFKTSQPHDASLRIWYFYTEGGVHIICTQEVLWKRRGGEKKREHAV